MVSLRLMTEEEFQGFLGRNVPEYAADKVRAGNWTPEEAEQKSREEFTRLLPDGLASAHQHLYTIELDGSPVGDLWLSSDPRLAVVQRLFASCGIIQLLRLSPQRR